MSRFQMQIATEHPLLYLSDDAIELSIPEDAGERFVAATPNCVSFYVLSHVDGASVVTVADEDCKLGGSEMFKGVVEASTGRLAVSDSRGFKYLTIPVPPGPVSVRLWADDGNNPDWVWIQLGAIQSY